MNLPLYSNLYDHRQKSPPLFLHTFLWSTFCFLSYQLQDNATAGTHLQGEEQEDSAVGSPKSYQVDEEVDEEEE